MTIGNCLVPPANPPHLNPIIWSALPHSMIEQVLCKLPFAMMIQLRRVCKAWDRIILSMCSAPPNPAPKQLLVCSPAGGGLHLVTCNLKENTREDWFPSFLSPLLQPTGGLCLVAAGIGLLCFSTRNAGRLLMWNPISKMCRQLPQAHVLDGVNPQDMLKNCHQTPSSSSTVDVTLPTALAPGLGCVMVTLVTHRHDRSFKLFVAASFDNNQTLQMFDTRTSSWKTVSRVPNGGRFKFECEMVFANDYLYAIVDGVMIIDSAEGEAIDEGSSNSRWWNIVRYNVDSDEWGEVIPPPHVVAREQQLRHFHTTQRPQLVVHHGNLWLIVEGLLNCSICFYELGFIEGLENEMIMPWRLDKEISRDLFWGTMVVLHKCVALEDLIYFRVFDILPEGSAQLIMLVYDISSDSWSLLNDRGGLDGRYFLYHSFVYEPSLNAMV